MRCATAILSVGLSILSASTAFAQNSPPRNLILFVPDGLRALKVTPETAPAMAALRDKGVNFKNSHSLFPTFTMANASGMASGHYLGDTGIFSNSIFTGHPTPVQNGSPIPFIEHDQVLGDLDEQFNGDYLNEETLLKAARNAGFSTAALGKVGPTLMFDHTERTGTKSIILDDQTGALDKDGKLIGIPLSDEIKAALTAANMPLATPGRGDNGKAGDAKTPVRHVGDEVLPQPFEPPQFCCVVQHHDRAERLGAGQPGDVDGQVLRPRPLPVEFLAVRAVAGQRLFDDLLHRPLPRHFPQLAADAAGGVELQQHAGAVVGEQDALLRVERDDALDHAGQDRPQLLAVVLDLRETRREALAHGVERPRQGVELRAAGRADLVAQVAVGQPPRAVREFVQRPRQAAGEDVGGDDRQHRDADDCGGDFLREFEEDGLALAAAEDHHADEADGDDDEREVRQEQAPEHG